TNRPKLNFPLFSRRWTSNGWRVRFCSATILPENWRSFTDFNAAVLHAHSASELAAGDPSGSNRGLYSLGGNARLDPSEAGSSHVGVRGRFPVWHAGRRLRGSRSEATCLAFAGSGANGAAHLPVGRQLRLG